MNFAKIFRQEANMRSQIATFLFAIVFGAETSATHAQLLARRDLSYSIAKTIAETAIESCTAGGYRVSAVVVDRDGETIVALRGDNASPHETPPSPFPCQNSRLLLARIQAENRGVLRDCRLAGLDPKRSSSATY